MSSDDRAQIDRLLKIHRRNLATLETQAANYGGEINAPLNVVNQLDSTREQIRNLEAQLAAGAGSSTGIGIIGSPGASVDVTGSNVAGRGVVNSSSGGEKQAPPPPASAPPTTLGPKVEMTFARRVGANSALETFIGWDAGEIFGERETKFVSPYDQEDLTLVIHALDVLQYPSYPNPQTDGETKLFTFSEADQQLLAALGLWKDGHLSRDAYQVVGKALYQGFDADGQNLLRQIRDAVASQRLSVRYVLRFPNDPKAFSLAVLPWEALWDASRNQAVLIRGRQVDSCERYINMDAVVPPPLSGGEELHILALSPSYGIPEDVRQQEQDARNKVWDELKAIRKLRVGEVTPLTRDALLQYLDEAPTLPDIVHYFGHGIYQDGKGYLVFDDGEGGMDLVGAEQLQAMLGDTRLVVIHACQSAMVSEIGGLLTGVAPSLSAVTGAVVAMQLTVRISAAIRFTEIFYRELLTKKFSLQEAVAQARKRLFVTDTSGASWYVPTLYIRSRDQEPVYLVK